jgi:hypothetical protein
LTGYYNRRKIHIGYNHYEEAGMHPFLQAQLAALHESDLKAAATRAQSSSKRRRKADSSEPADVVIRRTTSGDGPALAALSALDAAPMPFGPALVAEVSGSPRAVLPLDGGRPFGDPFRRTDELVALLELRAAQIRRENGEQPGQRRRQMLAWTLPSSLRRLV